MLGSAKWSSDINTLQSRWVAMRSMFYFSWFLIRPFFLLFLKKLWRIFFNQKLIFVKYLKKKHDILSGVGSCARFGFTDTNTYYCGTGPQCNNFIGKTCWNPAGNAQATAPCSSSDWQCKVWAIEISQIIFIMFIYVLFFFNYEDWLKNRIRFMYRLRFYRCRCILLWHWKQLQQLVQL